MILILKSDVTDEQVDQIKVIIDFAERENFGPTWQDTPIGTFVVGDSQQFFKVHANGHIGFPFTRLNAGDLFPKLFDRLNEALQEQHFQAGDERRKKARDGIREQVLGTLFEDQIQLQAFLDVWKWFASVRR